MTAPELRRLAEMLERAGRPELARKARNRAAMRELNVPRLVGPGILHLDLGERPTGPPGGGRKVDYMAADEYEDHLTKRARDGR